MVGDASFWAKLDAVLLLLRPINASLAEFWSDASTSSDFYKVKFAFL
ncbi:hypothetical protein L917_21450 [Phytophthora nicotianae]|uniref:Uncharacterized protein n=1 Tax=Phytophthora nicotianae TaxID=4792 RepID=W2JXK2_PHYNI|nr:hypothetical protein L917_21450 [Phytophthora nicotianae]